MDLKNEIEVLDNPIMVKIDGKSFRCGCGCNIFRHPESTKGLESYKKQYIYECNACETLYLGGN